SEHGDLIHTAVRVIAARTGETVGELHDPGLALLAACWSPVPGDARLAVVDERSDDERPAIWDLHTGERVPVRVEGPEGPVTVNPHGQRVHGFHVTPEGPGPFPVIMRVHGGPTWLDSDRWQPEVQSLVDAGFAVGMVNYRGSIGYGRAWRDEIIGNVGRPELEDVNAGLDDLVSEGIADPRRAAGAGPS